MLTLKEERRLFDRRFLDRRLDDIRSEEERRGPQRRELERRLAPVVRRRSKRASTPIHE